MDLTELLGTIYLRSPGELHNIITFGRAPEQRSRDYADGVARIGGPLRQPNYAQAYIHAASVLIAQGEADGTLDEIALPCFYLQRHAVELLLKQVLSLLIEISAYKARDTQQPAVHSNNQADRLKSSHTLTKLLKDAYDIAGKLNLPPPPAELTAVATAINGIEFTETWPRYSTSKDGVQHLEREVEVPLRTIQSLLAAASETTAYKATEEKSYEWTLYEEWRPYAERFGDIGGP